MRDKLIKRFFVDYKLALLIILAAILRFYNLDFQSPWVDEIYTMMDTNPLLSYGEFYEMMLLKEKMPHLYFLIVKVFTYLFGHSVVIVRSVSVLIGVASVYSIYLLGKELVSKNAGLFAALFLTVNHHHIYYSQEARPYVLLGLFTILSFLFLLKFSKKWTIKSGIYYAIFSGLMINTHFFGLFILVAQAAILLIYLSKLPKEHKKKAFINSIIIGGATVLLFLPSLSIFIGVSKLNKFWIKPPSPDFFKDLFNRFFGNSEFIIYTAVLLVIAFLVKCFSEKEKNVLKGKNRYLNSFIFLIVWLFLICMIPYIRSYTNNPILLPRYLISALPPMILIIAIGLTTIKSKTISVIIASIFVFSSLVDLIIVKDYYGRVTKTQFRETTNELNIKNIENQPVISPWAWQLEYFINKNETKLIKSPFNKYVNEFRLGKKKLSKFWFFDAHTHKYKVTPKNQAFLDKNFYVIEEIDYHDAFIKYFLPKNRNQTKVLNLNEFIPQKAFKKNFILLNSNHTTVFKQVDISKGKYRIALNVMCDPNPLINTEKAHINVYINGKKVGDFYTASKKPKTTIFDFSIEDEETNSTIEINFDKDNSKNKGVRAMRIYSISIEELTE